MVKIHYIMKTVKIYSSFLLKINRKSYVLLCALFLHFASLDRGRFVIVLPHSILSTPLGGATTGCRRCRCDKIWRFSHLKGDRINQSGWHISVRCWCAPVCQIWPWLLSGGYRSPPNFRNCPNLCGYAWLCIVVYSDHSKICVVEDVIGSL